MKRVSVKNGRWKMLVCLSCVILMTNSVIAEGSAAEVNIIEKTAAKEREVKEDVIRESDSGTEVSRDKSEYRLTGPGEHTLFMQDSLGNTTKVTIRINQKMPAEGKNGEIPQSDLTEGNICVCEDDCTEGYENENCQVCRFGSSLCRPGSARKGVAGILADLREKPLSITPYAVILISIGILAVSLRNRRSLGIEE